VGGLRLSSAPLATALAWALIARQGAAGQDMAPTAGNSLASAALAFASRSRTPFTARFPTAIIIDLAATPK